MANMKQVSGGSACTRGARRVAALAAVVIAGAALSSAGVQAQQKAPAQKAAPAQQPAVAAPAAGGGGAQSAWVKLCEVASIEKRGADGKPVKEDRNLCLTHHERLDGTTGMVIVSAAVRQLEGLDKQVLMVMVPLGMAIQPGLRAAVYNKEQWEKVNKNEKVDEKQLKPIEFIYSLCHPAGCTAEIDASKDILDQLKAGAGVMVLAMNASGQPIAFPVPLDGFNAALTGQPVDNNEYTRARAQLMLQIRQRQTELMQQYEQEQAKQQAGGGQAQQPAAAQPAAKAPAKK